MSARLAEAVEAQVDVAVETVRDPSPAATPVPDRNDMPLPNDTRTIFWVDYLHSLFWPPCTSPHPSC